MNMQTGNNNVRPRRNVKNIISSVASEYCSSTSIHGLKYLRGEERNIAEKGWWLIVFIMSATICGYMILQSWTKWKETPIIITVSTSQSSVSDIPFPAVTLCPLHRIIRYPYNYTYALLFYTLLKGKAYEKFWDISLICDDHYIDIPDDMQFRDDEVYVHIRQAYCQDSANIDSTPYPNILVDYMDVMYWLGEKHGRIGKDYFTPVLTDEGLCLSFNTLTHDDMYRPIVKRKPGFFNHNMSIHGWSIEHGYAANAYGNIYPRRSSRAGTKAGLQVPLMTFGKHIEPHCSPNIRGFKIFLHNPYESPRKEQYTLVQLDCSITLSVTPNMVTTSKGIKDIPPHTRYCYFPEEKQLKYYTVYTQNNCKLECSVNITKELCDCVPFHLPREAGTHICGISKLSCIHETKEIIFNYEMKVNLPENANVTRWHQILDQCDCLPSCNLLEYDVKTSHTKLRYGGDLPGYSIFDTGIWQFSEVNVFYRSQNFLSLHRSELFNKINFLSTCGGLLGLFMGFSIFSLVEVAYFFIVRLFCKLRNREKSVDSNERIFTITREINSE